MGLSSWTQFLQIITEVFHFLIKMLTRDIREDEHENGEGGPGGEITPQAMKNRPTTTKETTLALVKEKAGQSETLRITKTQTPKSFWGPRPISAPTSQATASLGSFLEALR